MKPKLPRSPVDLGYFEVMEDKNDKNISTQGVFLSLDFVKERILFCYKNNNDYRYYLFYYMDKKRLEI
jgi:hypothetical protein